jgi:hypothetical protein
MFLLGERAVCMLCSRRSAETTVEPRLCEGRVNVERVQPYGSGSGARAGAGAKLRKSCRDTPSRHSHGDEATFHVLRRTEQRTRPGLVGDATGYVAGPRTFTTEAGSRGKKVCGGKTKKERLTGVAMRAITIEGARQCDRKGKGMVTRVLLLSSRSTISLRLQGNSLSARRKGD